VNLLYCQNTAATNTAATWGLVDRDPDNFRWRGAANTSVSERAIGEKKLGCEYRQTVVVAGAAASCQTEQAF
jgi:hypothetical protein